MRIIANKRWICVDIDLTKNKEIEFQISKWPKSKWFECKAHRRRGDHAGLEICITLFKIQFRGDFYDKRHTEHY